MDQQHLDIAPPPSLDDILSATPDTRLGRVDFNQRLSSDTGVTAGEDSAGADPTSPTPPDLDPETGHDSDAVTVPETDFETEAEAPAPVAPLRSAPRGPAPHEAPTPVAVPQPTFETSSAELDYVGLSVDDVAASVIARMREAGEASRRHLESIEAEAARRCELLTAQAELDAELIRLHARREAHAIITAARMRAGAETVPTTDHERLNQIGDSFSRFAESIETAVAESPQAPDHPLRP